MTIDWLPAIISFSDFDGDWNKYINHLFSIFEKDFIKSRPIYNGLPVYFDRDIENGRPRCFWHLITETEGDINRTDETTCSLLRCERIPWIRAILDNHKDQAVSVWENTRGRFNNVVLMVEEADYVVILNSKKNYYLVTAYYINYPLRKQQLIKERDNYYKSKTAPEN